MMKDYITQEHTTTYLENVTLSKRALKVAETLSDSGFLKLRQVASGLIVETGSYIGGVKLDSANIVIRPKFTSDRMLFKMFAYSLELEDITFLDDYVDFPATKGWITDLLVMCLVKEIDNILLKGLLRRYKEQEENLTSLRGKIDFNRLAGQYARGAVSIPCRFEGFSTDILENRILLATLNLVFSWLSSPPLLSRVSYLIELLSEEARSDFPLDRMFEDLERKEDRLGNYYRRALYLCHLIYQATAFTFRGNGIADYQAFLFDMNSLFEKFIYRILKDCAPFDYQIKYQKGIGGYYESGGKRSSSLIPDFQTYYHNQRVCVADAKYKLYEDRRVDSVDLYQLTAYKLAGNTEDVVIYYPAQNKFSSYYELRGSEGKELLRIRVVGIPLTDILEQINDKGAIKKSARRWIWGELLNCKYIDTRKDEIKINM